MTDSGSARRNRIAGRAGQSGATDHAPARTCILVAGMHRSGTSALTRVMNLHGAALGAGTLGKGADNETGFWENLSVLAIHEGLLTDLGRSWSDPRPLPEHWRRTPAARRAEQAIADVLASEFGTESLFAIKDPRLGPFLKLWLKTLKRMHIRPTVCIPFRNPVEVAASLAQRNHLPTPLSQLLWRQSVAASARNSRNLSRVAVSFDALLDDWRAAIQRIGVALDIDWPRSDDATAAQVEAFLSGNRRHHMASSEAPGLELMFGALQALEGDGDHAAAWKQIELGVADPLATVHFEYAELLDYRSLPAHAAVARQAEGMHDASTPAGIEQGDSRVDLDKFAESNGALQMSTLVLHEEQDGLEIHEGSPGRSGGVVQVFYRTSDESHAEERSRMLRWPAASNIASFAFRFHEAVEIDALRIDFDDFPGVFLLDRLEIDGQLIDVPSLVTGRHGMLLGDGVTSTVGLVGSDNDPWIEVNVAGTRCRTVIVSITRIPLNDAVHTMRATLDVRQRLDMLFQRVASSGDSILASQRDARDWATQRVQQTDAVVLAQSEALDRLEQRMLGSAEAASRLDARVITAGQQLDVIAGQLAAHASRFDAGIGVAAQTLEGIAGTLESHAVATGALAEMAGQQRQLVEQVAARVEAHAGSAGTAFALIRGDLGVVAQAQSRTETRLEAQLVQSLDGLDARLLQGLDGIVRLESGVVQAIDGLRGLDARLSGGLRNLDTLAAAVARQRDEIDAVAAHAQQQARELEAMAAVLDEVNRSRFGWRLRKLFGRPALPKQLGH